MEPNSRPPWPALARSFTWQPLSCSAAAIACAFSSASRACLALSCIFMVFTFSAVASTASLRGRRKLRPYPSDTSTIWPFLPWPFTSCCKITFMLFSSNLIGCLAAVHPRGSRRVRASFVTLPLFAARGFPSSQAKPGPTLLALGFCPRCGPSARLTTGPRFLCHQNSCRSPPSVPGAPRPPSGPAPAPQRRRHSRRPQGPPR